MYNQNNQVWKLPFIQKKIMVYRRSTCIRSWSCKNCVMMMMLMERRWMRYSPLFVMFLLCVLCHACKNREHRILKCLQYFLWRWWEWQRRRRRRKLVPSDSFVRLVIWFKTIRATGSFCVLHETQVNSSRPHPPRKIINLRDYIQCSCTIFAGTWESDSQDFFLLLFCHFKKLMQSSHYSLWSMKWHLQN